MYINLTIKEFQAVSVRKRQNSTDNAAVDRVVPYPQVPGCILFACVIGIGVPRAECFRVHPFFSKNKNLITAEDLYEYYFRNVS